MRGRTPHQKINTPRELSSKDVEEYHLFISPYVSKLSKTSLGRSLFLSETGFLALADSQVRNSENLRSFETRIGGYNKTKGRQDNARAAFSCRGFSL